MFKSDDEATGECEQPRPTGLIDYVDTACTLYYFKNVSTLAAYFLLSHSKQCKQQTAIDFISARGVVLLILDERECWLMLALRLRSYVEITTHYYRVHVIPYTEKSMNLVFTSLI